MSNQSRDDAMSGLFRALVAFGRTTRSLATGIAEQPDLSRTDVVLLGIVAECGPCRSSALAERTGVGPSVISRQVAHLQDLELVERATDPDDGRAGLVSLSPAGAERLAAGRAAYVARLSERLAAWDDDKVRAMDDLLCELTGLLAGRDGIDRPGNDPKTTKEEA